MAIQFLGWPPDKTQQVSGAAFELARIIQQQQQLTQRGEQQRGELKLKGERQTSELELEFLKRLPELEPLYRRGGPQMQEALNAFAARYGKGPEIFAGTKAPEPSAKDAAMAANLQARTTQTRRATPTRVGAAVDATLDRAGKVKDLLTPRAVTRTEDLIDLIPDRGKRLKFYEDQGDPTRAAEMAFDIAEKRFAADRAAGGLSDVQNESLRSAKARLDSAIDAAARVMSAQASSAIGTRGAAQRQAATDEFWARFNTAWDAYNTEREGITASFGGTGNLRTGGGVGDLSNSELDVQIEAAR